MPCSDITALLGPDQPATSIKPSPMAGLPNCMSLAKTSCASTRCIAGDVSIGWIELPAGVFGHGFLTREGQKMGKSMGIPLILTVCLSSAAAMLCAGICCATFNSVMTEISSSNASWIWSQRSSEHHRQPGESLHFDGAQMVEGSITASRAPQRPPLEAAAQAAVADVASNYQQLRFHAVAEQALQLAIAANGYLSDQALEGPTIRRTAIRLLRTKGAGSLPCSGCCLQPLCPSSVNSCCSSSMLLRPVERSLTWGSSAGPLDPPSPLLQRLELEEAI